MSLDKRQFDLPFEPTKETSKKLTKEEVMEIVRQKNYVNLTPDQEKVWKEVREERSKEEDRESDKKDLYGNYSREPKN